MEAFYRWAQAHGITFKNRHAKKSGLVVWEAMQKELAEQKKQYNRLAAEFKAVGGLLEEIKIEVNSLKTSDNNKA